MTVFLNFLFQAEPFATILIAHGDGTHGQSGTARYLSSGNCEIRGRWPRAGKRFLTRGQRAIEGLGQWCKLPRPSIARCPLVKNLFPAHGLRPWISQFPLDKFLAMPGMKPRLQIHFGCTKSTSSDRTCHLVPISLFNSAEPLNTTGRTLRFRETPFKNTVLWHRTSSVSTYKIIQTVDITDCTTLWADYIWPSVFLCGRSDGLELTTDLVSQSVRRLWWL